MTSRTGTAWWRLVGPLSGVIAVAGLWHTAALSDRALRVDVAAAAAEGAAGLFSLTVPADRTGAYDGGRLLSNASLLVSSAFWQAGLQVASGATPLLPDPSNAAPPASDVAERLRGGSSPEIGVRPDGNVTVFVPLRDRALQSVRGWVEVWDAMPPTGVPLFRMVLAVCILLALGRTAWLTTTRATAWQRRVAAAIPMALMLVLGVASMRSLRATAGEATDVSLMRARRLAEVASVSRRRSVAELARLAPGMQVESADSLDLGRSVRRDRVEGAPEASVAGVLSGGRPIRLSMVPYRSRLDGVWAELTGWVLLLVAGVAFSAWAAGAVAQRQRFRGTLTAWGFLAPAASHLLVFSFGPLLFILWLSLHRWGLDGATHPWVGVANFASVLGDTGFWHSLGVTVLYAMYVPVALVLALGAALLLDRSGWSIRVLRGVLVLPCIASVVAVSLVWQWIYHPEFGALNAILGAVGIRGPDWLGDPRTALVALMFIAVWVHVGFQMIILLAGLQSIPRDYHDAARVDGAGVWQRFRHVTLPLLQPTILFVLVTGTVAAFQVFTVVSVVTHGGPLHATDVAVYRIYQEGWASGRFGTASAMSVLLALLLGGAVWLEFRWLGRRVAVV
ncbi:MAG: carbohydrate ABC transporter permease [Gemmatimonadales bacterium]